MPPAPFTIGATVVTPTAHLARELLGQFDQHQLTLGNSAWESADILPWGAWLERLWKTAALPTMLLNELQVAAVWEDIIARDIRNTSDATPLWNLHATAQTALGAWRVVNEWQIEIATCAKSPQEDHQCFVRWARAYLKRRGEKKWMDAYQLAAQVCELAENKKFPREATNATIEVIGFDGFQPQQQAVIAALQTAGVAITVTASPPSVNQKTECHTYPDEASQWLAAAHWAREKLAATPHARLAIIAPDLAGTAAAIEYALHQLLAPQQLAAPTVTADLPWHRALGDTLSRHAIANAALVALAPLAGGLLPTDAFCQLIRSPFIRGADVEADARARLEVWCRAYLPYQIRWRAFAKEISARDGCPKLIAAVNAVCELQDDGAHNKSQPAAYWVEFFDAWLKKIGWHDAQTLNSDEYQIARAFHRELHNLALLDLTSPPMNAAAALAWLRRRLERKPFQVEANDAPVQVLGVLEAAGQTFDGVWFGNLVESDWPPALRPNPFIKPSLQREAGVVAASVQNNLTVAEAQQQRIISGAREVILSVPMTVEEVPVAASPLLAEFAVRENDAGTFNTPATVIHAAKPELDAFIDPTGPAHDPQTPATGGARLIEDQAQCPFRAFAIHRLGARADGENEQGLSPADRGSLIHKALQLVWEEVSSSKNLHALSDDALKKIIDVAAAQAAKSYAVISGCGDAFHHAQINWVCDTVTEWMEMEKLRAGEFTVIESEQKNEVVLNGLTLTLRMDRIDELKNKTFALIDYKTGTPATVTEWADDRPPSPQLPLYAINRAAVAEVLYGVVRRGDCYFSGITRAAAYSKVKSADGGWEAFADWDALLNHWRDALNKLAQEFLDGDARVAPQKNACQFCDLPSFCRIEHER